MLDEVADIQALAGLGWVDGRNVWMDLRWAGANTNRMRALAQEAEAELPARLHTAIAGLREAGRRRKEVAA